MTKQQKLDRRLRAAATVALMTTQQQDALARAIDYLGAIEVAPGRYYAMRDGEDDCYTVYPLSDVQRVAVAIEKYGEHDGIIAAWQSGDMPTHGVAMPSWWTPEQPFYCTACKKATQFPGHFKNGPEHTLITADLETGEEVPA